MPDLPKRPGISAATLTRAEVKLCSYPELGSIEIPYRDIDGKPTGFSRYRLPKERPDGQKYHQESGSGVHVYFPPGGSREAPTEFALEPDSLLLVEGEFKALSLAEAGIPALGLPGFNVYRRDEHDEPHLLGDLALAVSKWKIEHIYFWVTPTPPQISNSAAKLSFWRKLCRVSRSTCHGYR